ncbi:hypothetical protein DLNHIDIE_00282 [Acidithiobacillus thiooxidans ATCC 19377]|jgi:hypothetical protein|uniref:Uncharacterized protein n=1 Tax=Acidithiobacillus thiooxidans ATCC 19377 TaxID=637390 RepID=A0A543Q260_ACITH|nr:hypothetical protein DLNHIDIE_00282 [Acidithiobacillus thiooxidans ATCC 19377]
MIPLILFTCIVSGYLISVPIRLALITKGWI